MIKVNPFKQLKATAATKNKLKRVIKCIYLSKIKNSQMTNLATAKKRDLKKLLKIKFN